MIEHLHDIFEPVSIHFGLALEFQNEIHKALPGKNPSDTPSMTFFQKDFPSNL